MKSAKTGEVIKLTTDEIKALEKRLRARNRDWSYEDDGSITVMHADFIRERNIIRRIQEKEQIYLAQVTRELKVKMTDRRRALKKARRASR